MHCPSDLLAVHRGSNHCIYDQLSVLVWRAIPVLEKQMGSLDHALCLGEGYDTDMRCTNNLFVWMFFLRQIHFTMGNSVFSQTRLDGEPPIARYRKALLHWYNVDYQYTGDVSRCWMATRKCRTFTGSCLCKKEPFCSSSGESSDCYLESRWAVLRDKVRWTVTRLIIATGGTGFVL